MHKKYKIRESILTNKIEYIFAHSKRRKKNIMCYYSKTKEIKFKHKFYSFYIIQDNKNSNNIITVTLLLFSLTQIIETE